LREEDLGVYFSSKYKTLIILGTKKLYWMKGVESLGRFI